MVLRSNNICTRRRQAIVAETLGIPSVIEAAPGFDEEACRRVGRPTWERANGLSVNDNSITLPSAIL